MTSIRAKPVIFMDVLTKDQTEKELYAIHLAPMFHMMNSQFTILDNNSVL